MRLVRLLVPVVLLALTGGTAWAEGRQSGIVITPPFQQVVLNQGPETTIAFSLKNNSSVPQSFALKTYDFKQLNETGGVAFIGQQGSNPTYGLAKWMKLDVDKIRLEPGQTASISGEILNLPDLAPGGHYGAIVFQSLDNSLPGKNKVDFTQAGSSLFFVVKNGGAKHDIRLEGIKGLPRFGINPPTNLKIRFSNHGNVHETPRGVISVKGARDKDIYKAAINTDSVIILPDSKRIIDTELQKVGKVWWPGRYKVAVNYRSDSSEQVSNYETSIWLMGALGPAAILLLILLAAIGYFYRSKIAAILSKIRR